MAKRKRRVKKGSNQDFSFVTNHNLVPKHSKVSEKEKNSLLERYHLELAHLPKIFTDDPAIQHLDVKPGDVVKIMRASPTAGQSVFYRVVIEGV
jgi:DNA-directed RNA polymerase subunit H